MRFLRLLRFLLIGAVIGGLVLAGAIPVVGIAQAAAGDPPCGGWTLHTRTLHTICPEVVVDHIPGLPGIATIGGLAFDSAGALYVSRPGTGQVIRLAADGFLFDAPQVVADSLTLPGGIACNGLICAVATDTAIFPVGTTRPTGTPQPLVDHLPSDGFRPLAIGADGSLLTTIGGQMVRFAPIVQGGASQSPETISGLPSFATGIALGERGIVWAADGKQLVQAANRPPVPFDADSAPYAIALYPNRADVAFSDFRGDLLVTTAGSWDGLTIAGYELWAIPVDGQGNAGIPQKLIPAESDLNSSDSSLFALTFYPDHPIALAIDPRGWIYVATREGRIVRLRPRV